jgi:uncharacterized DUF497 family protein
MYIIDSTILFIWDPDKNRKNIAKHGIDFADAKKLFDQDFIVGVDVGEYTEERLLAYGYLQGQPLVVVYTQPASHIYRLISARLATVREEQHLLLNLNKEKRRQKRIFRKTRKDPYKIKEFE